MKFVVEWSGVLKRLVAETSKSFCCGFRIYASLFLASQKQSSFDIDKVFVSSQGNFPRRVQVGKQIEARSEESGQTSGNAFAMPRFVVVQMCHFSLLFVHFCESILLPDRSVKEGTQTPSNINPHATKLGTVTFFQHGRQIADQPPGCSNVHEYMLEI